MLAVEVRRAARGKEKLRAVGVGAGVGHREQELFRVSDDAVFELVVELLSVDGLTPCAIATREVASLAHESRDHPMETRALKVEFLA